MRLTTKGRYSVTAMLDLALHGVEHPVSLADISGRQDISLSYLEQLFAKLRRRSLVSSVRGPGGGYNLARPAGEIPVSEVIAAVDENVDTTKCGRAGNCHDGEPCLTHELWLDLSDRIYEYLSRITLQHLVERREAKTGSREVPPALDLDFGTPLSDRAPASAVPVTS